MEDEIKQYIAQGRVEEALRIVLSASKESHVEDDVLLLSARMRQLKKRETLGIISHSESNLEQNRLVYALLSITNQLKEDGIFVNGNNSGGQLASSLPLVIFLSSSPQDQVYVDQLTQHLQTLRRSGYVKQLIQRGELALEANERPTLVNEIEHSDLVLIALSPAYLGSPFSEELFEELENTPSSSKLVIYILLEEVNDLSQLPQSSLILPGNKVPIKDWKYKDQGWLQVIRGLKRVMEHLPSRIE
jgi:hypothetical protein